MGSGFAFPGRYCFIPQDFTLLSIHANQVTNKLVRAAIAADTEARIACDKDAISGNDGTG